MWKLHNEFQGNCHVGLKIEFTFLLKQYLKANPSAQNPRAFKYYLTEKKLIQILKKANNRKIRFYHKPNVLDAVFWEIEG